MKNNLIPTDYKNRLKKLKTMNRRVLSEGYGIDDTLLIGKYRGCTVREISKSDPRYLIYMAENRFMTFDKEVEEKLTWLFEDLRDGII